MTASRTDLTRRALLLERLDGALAEALAMDPAPTARAGVSRRSFLRVVGLGSAGLAIAITLPGCGTDEPPPPVTGQPPFRPNAWITLNDDGTVDILVDEMEMGQGVMTSVPMIIAEELDVPWSAVRVSYGPEDPSTWPRPVGTGGSTTVRTGWDTFRRAGATGRALMIAAAAATWGVPASEVRTEAGVVRHDLSGRRLHYQELLERAATLEPPDPETVPLKSPAEFRIVGERIPRVDTADKVDGSRRYGIDTQLDGMLVAAVARSPVFGGRVRSFDATAAERIPGVRHVVPISSGVAVVADDTWSAFRGRDALAVTWEEGRVADISTESLDATLDELSTAPGAPARDDGDVEAVLAAAPAERRVEAVYRAPYLAHACMEPLNCTADVRADGAEIWVPTQNATNSQRVAAQLTGLPESAIRVHAIPMGGGFGRRSNTDFVAEAVETSRAVRVPVKVVWSREDDTRGGFYRPVAMHRFRAALDAQGMPTAWSHRVAAPSILRQLRPGPLRDGVDGDAVAGAAELPYAIPNLRVEYAMADPGIPLWWWRAVGHSHNAFSTESFLDELAHAGGHDPVAFRRTLLADAPRLRAVLDAAAERAGWDSPPPAGRSRGVAAHASFGSFVAQVAEVSVDAGRVRVHRVVCAVDCGRVVNPDTVEAQIQSSIVYGLSAALYGEITLRNGRPLQGNFDTYRVLRMDEMPLVEVVIAESDEEPGGIGETGLPPIAPALANAIHSATGQRVRRLPIRLELAPEASTAGTGSRTGIV